MPQNSSELPSGKRLQKAIENGPVELVDLRIENMVDLSSSLRKRLPEGIACYCHDLSR